MLFKNHVIAGLVASTAVMGGCSFFGCPTEDLPVAFGLCLVGSLIPDLDTNSKPSKIIALFGWIFCLYSLFIREPYPALIFSTAFLFIKTFNHRTWTHVWSLPAVLVLVSIKFQVPMLIPFAIGLCVHYAVDCFGPQKMLPWKVSSWVKPIKII